MSVLSKIDTVEYFKELPFYKKPIEKPKLKRLKNIDRLVELPFYKQLSVTKLNQAFQGYAMSYKVELIEKKIQLYNQKQVNQVLKIFFVIFYMTQKGLSIRLLYKFCQKNASPMEKLNLLHFILIQ